MRIASFNVENFFSRVRAMNTQDAVAAKTILSLCGLNARIARIVYRCGPDGDVLPRSKPGSERSDESTWAILRQNHGKLLRRPQGGGITISPRVARTGSDGTN